MVKRSLNEAVFFTCQFQCNNYKKNCEDNDEEKYKWYSFFNQFVINEEEILTDSFWNDEEKQAIAKIFNHEKVAGLVMYPSAFMHEHLDVIVILNRGKFYGNRE